MLKIIIAGVVVGAIVGTLLSGSFWRIVKMAIKRVLDR